ncbi:MAG: DUF4856 domain-containing protein [Hymenobacteraceae bacterium]|nr:DUF4856 domain-containing protein [Hymenobacteraceae bacterium]
MRIASSAVVLLACTLGFTSCKKDDDVITPTTPALRARVDYASFTSTSPYSTSFKDSGGQSTVVLEPASAQLNMLTELDAYMKLAAVATGAPSVLDSTHLHNLFTNTGAPFTDATLNTSGVRLREQTSRSFAPSAATAVRAYFDTKLTNLATASKAVNVPATMGNAGRQGRYLVDATGLELGQIVQKALIGAVLLDQINNVLLTDQALQADNSQVVTGQNYSLLEHTWDLAYGCLTTNATLTTSSAALPRERFLASYLNEKNAVAAPGVYIAFLKGRAAIVNNDAPMVRAQAATIRTQLEKTIALSAVSYLGAWKAATDAGTRAHALGEGIGFVYALRFCSTHGANSAWSDQVLTNLLSKPFGAWELTDAEVDAALDTINAKFGL